MKTSLALILFLLPAAVALAEVKSPDATRVEDAYSTYINALLSDNQETRIEGIRRAMPTEKDVRRIWADERKADLAWEIIEEVLGMSIAYNKNAHANVTAMGKLTDISVRDYRKMENDIVTRVVPAAIPLFKISATHEQESVTFFGMVVEGRAVLVHPIVEICTALEKLGPGAGGADHVPARPVKQAQEVDRTDPQAVAEAFWKATLAQEWEKAATFVEKEDREWYLDGIAEEFEKLQNPPKRPVIKAITKNGITRAYITNWEEIEDGLDMTEVDGLWWIEN